MKKLLLGTAMLLMFSISVSAQQSSSDSVEEAGCRSGGQHYCDRNEL